MSNQNHYSILSDNNVLLTKINSTENVVASPQLSQKLNESPQESYKPNRSFKKFFSNKSTRNNNNNKRVNSRPVPKAVIDQLQLRKKYNYCYRVVNNGNVENNTTLYVTTGVAHPYQVENLFKDVIENAKKMPEIFGTDFECDFKVNLVRRYTEQYLGYAFVDLSNPKLYFALIGCDVNGNDRAEYVDDPNWVPPKNTINPDCEIPIKSSWADLCDENLPIAAPKIRKELPPLIELGSYEYDTEQRKHLQTEETYGTVSVSPAFITPGVKEDYDDCCLYVSEVPDVDYDFLYAIFARYARTNNPNEDENHFYPKITIRECARGKELKTNESKTKDNESKPKDNENKTRDNESKTGIFAIVEYASAFDAAFSRTMLQKIRANYKGKDVYMPVRHAFKHKN